MLVITGRFDPAVAREQIELTLARLPAGERAGEPARTAALRASAVAEVVEGTARRPRVTLAWALEEPLREQTEALSFGALLLTLMTNGFIGMGVKAELYEYTRGALFVLEVTLPHVADRVEALGNAEGILRYLSRALFPRELIAPTYQAVDRLLMMRLASASGLASLLTRMETLPSEPVLGVPFTERHWQLGSTEIQEIAKRALAAPRLTLISMPTRPLPLRVPK